MGVPETGKKKTFHAMPTESSLFTFFCQGDSRGRLGDTGSKRGPISNPAGSGIYPAGSGSLLMEQGTLGISWHCRYLHQAGCGCFLITEQAVIHATDSQGVWGVATADV